MSPRTIRNQSAKGKVIMEIRQSIKVEDRTAVRLLVAVATIGAGGTLVGLTGGASSASTVAHSSSVVTLQFWNAYNDVTETP